MHTVKITCNTPAARLAGLAPEGPRYNSRVPLSFFKCLRNNSERSNLSKVRLRSTNSVALAVPIYLCSNQLRSRNSGRTVASALPFTVDLKIVALKVKGF